MKLLSKYNRVTLVTTIVVMLFTGIIYYVAIKLILVEDIDKDLAVSRRISRSILKKPLPDL